MVKDQIFLQIPPSNLARLRNFCQDEEFPLRMLHTAMPPAAAGAAAHRVNIYEAKGEDLGSRGDARQKDNGRCISGLKISKGSGRK